MCMKATVSAGSLSLLRGAVAPACSRPEPRQKEAGEARQGPHPPGAEPRKVN